MRPVATVIATVLWLVACGTKPPGDVLLISIDTLRADHLGTYGYAMPTSPQLDELAAESIVFENAWATAPWTLPSHASLLTGLYPSRHGARAPNRAISRDVSTLAEHAQRAGFATAGIVNVVFLSGTYGFARGFDHYHRVPSKPGRIGAAGRVNELALRWLDDQGDTPVFLFLHYFDVHSDYGSLPRFQNLFTRGGRRQGTSQELQRLQREGRPLADRDLAHLVGLYDGGIAQTDDHLGTLFRLLRARGRWENALVVVTSDHGEALGEQGRFSHGSDHFESILRVPLLIRMPGEDPRRIVEPVSIVDVMPTILSAMGVEVPDDLDGIDLLAGAALPRRALFAETTFADTAPRSVREGPAKLMYRPDRSPALFDLEVDPQEISDEAASEPERVAALASRLDTLPRDAAEPGDEVELPPAMLERLRALGYDTTSPPGANLRD